MLIKNQPKPEIDTLPRKELLKNLARGVALGIGASILISFLSPAGIKLSIFFTNIFFLTLGAIGGIIYAYLSPQQRSKTRKWILKAYEDINNEQKLYLIVCALAILILIGYATGISFGTKEFIILSLVFAGCVALRDFLSWYQAISENLLGKAILALGFAIASAFAYGLAGQKISYTIHVTPTNFVRTNLLIAIMMIPVIITVAGAFVSALGIVMSSLFILPFMLPGISKIAALFSPRTSQNQRVRFQFITRVFQVFFYTFVGASLWTFGHKAANWYDEFTTQKISSLVYEFDMYPGTECKLSDGSKIAPLGDAKFLVAKKQASGKIDFSPPIKCDDQ
jgi:hypothetical protein